MAFGTARITGKIINDPVIGLLTDRVFRRYIEILVCIQNTKSLELLAWELHTSKEDLFECCRYLEKVGILQINGDEIEISPLYDFSVPLFGTYRFEFEMIPDDWQIIDRFYTKLSDDNNAFYFIERVPDDPGVYFLFDREGTLIYIGSSKNLRKRIATSFRERNGEKQIRTVPYITCDDEEEARITESMLIAEYKPRLNIIDVNSLYGKANIDVYSLKREKVQIWPKRG